MLVLLICPAVLPSRYQIGPYWRPAKMGQVGGVRHAHVPFASPAAGAVLWPRPAKVAFSSGSDRNAVQEADGT